MSRQTRYSPEVRARAVRMVFEPAAGLGVFRDGGARPPVEAMIAFVEEHHDVHGGRADLPAAADRPVGSGPGARSKRC